MGLQFDSDTIVELRLFITHPTAANGWNMNPVEVRIYDHATTLAAVKEAQATLQGVAYGTLRTARGSLEKLVQQRQGSDGNPAGE